MKSNIEDLCVQTHKPPGRIDLIFMIIENLTGVVRVRYQVVRREVRREVRAVLTMGV